MSLSFCLTGARGYTNMTLKVTAEKVRIWVQGLRLSIRNDCGGHGRTTMLNTHLKVYDREGKLVEERHLETPAEFEDVLSSHFGIVR